MAAELTITQFSLIVGIAFGIIFGLALLITGFVKNNVKFGVLGFVLSLIAGSALSLIGVLPVFGIFLWLILRKPKPEEPVNEEVVNANPIDVSVKDAETSVENQPSGD